MDSTTIILLAKIVSDLLIIITMGLPKVGGLTEEEKRAMLKTLQDNTTKLTQAMYDMANR